jgi:hypothetical protein
MNLAWLAPVQSGAGPVPAGTIARVSRQPAAGYAAL